MHPEDGRAVRQGGGDGVEGSAAYAGIYVSVLCAVADHGAGFAFIVEHNAAADLLAVLGVATHQQLIASPAAEICLVVFLVADSLVQLLICWEIRASASQAAPVVKAGIRALEVRAFLGVGAFVAFVDYCVGVIIVAWVRDAKLSVLAGVLLIEHT
ncbi:MAG: hypothetical protein WC749_13945, partial [Dehalococcoidia bacterium]